MRRLGLAALAAGVLLVGCEKKKEFTKADDEDLTIVVSADRSRIAGEEASTRKAIEEVSESLRKEVEKLGASDKVATGQAGNSQETAKRVAEILEQQGSLNRKLEALAQQKDSLIDKAITRPEAATQAPAAPSSPAAPDLTRQIAARERDMAERERAVAGREKDIAERETSLAAREAQLAQRDSACAASAAAASAAQEKSQKVTRAGVDRAWRALMSSMDAKGVLVADLPPAKQGLIREASTARGAGELGRAMDVIEQAQAAVEALSIDGDFVSRKASRVNGLQKKGGIDTRAREEVARLLQDVTRAYSDGHYVEANRVLNNIVQLTEKTADKPGKAAR